MLKFRLIYGQLVKETKNFKERGGEMCCIKSHDGLEVSWQEDGHHYFLVGGPGGRHILYKVSKDFGREARIMSSAEAEEMLLDLIHLSNEVSELKMSPEVWDELSDKMSILRETKGSQSSTLCNQFFVANKTVTF